MVKVLLASRHLIPNVPMEKLYQTNTRAPEGRAFAFVRRST
jgi:hypothetical protein